VSRSMPCLILIRPSRISTAALVERRAKGAPPAGLRARMMLAKNRKFADSPLEEDGFELTVPPRGKGHGEPLHASIAVSDLKM